MSPIIAIDEKHTLWESFYHKVLNEKLLGALLHTKRDEKKHEMDHYSDLWNHFGILLFEKGKTHYESRRVYSANNHSRQRAWRRQLL